MRGIQGDADDDSVVTDGEVAIRIRHAGVIALYDPSWYQSAVDQMQNFIYALRQGSIIAHEMIIVGRVPGESNLEGNFLNGKMISDVSQSVPGLSLRLFWSGQEQNQLRSDGLVKHDRSAISYGRDALL